ncbi:transporter [Hygrophoropsis aurantiaca]|uniref:Transporter n=1 Tax=Hygrophoropsis aurantiaca TaxID=72124 RepID=A0ACB8A1G5_9AGAM|nr:transporter [Hygrophoropsis aurantiaca]
MASRSSTAAPDANVPLSLELTSSSQGESSLASQETSILLAGRRLAVVFLSFVVAFCLVAVDQTILSTALPTIASHFNAVSDLSWIASAYFLPQAAFMLFFGRVLTIAPAKPVFLTSIAIFELGSLFCAVSPSVNFLIFGRAVAGFGAAGLWVSIMSIVGRVTTMAQRPLLMGLFGAVFAVSSIVGPLLGGVFAGMNLNFHAVIKNSYTTLPITERVSWRWCFYINLPLGAFAIVIVALFLPNIAASDEKGSPMQRWKRLDWVGTSLSFAMVTFLLIALQWGGNEKPWNSASVVTLLVLSGGSGIAFFAWERRMGWNAILPLHIFLRESILGACFTSFFLLSQGVVLPLLYQSRGSSATQSGIDIIPYMMSGVITVVIAGGIITVSGYPWPFLVFFPLIASAAFGLLYTISPETSASRIIGYQILLGIGLGAAIQNTVVVAQGEVVNEPSLVPLATSAVTFMQLIGSSMGLAAAGAVFTSALRSELSIHLPDVPSSLIDAVASSVTVIFSLPEQEMTAAIAAYVSAVDRVYLIGVPAAALASLSALLVDRKKITLQQQPGAV